MATTEKSPALTQEQADSDEIMRLAVEGKRIINALKADFPFLVPLSSLP